MTCINLVFQFPWYYNGLLYEYELISITCIVMYLRSYVHSRLSESVIQTVHEQVPIKYRLMANISFVNDSCYQYI